MNSNSAEKLIISVKIRVGIDGGSVLLLAGDRAFPAGGDQGSER